MKNEKHVLYIYPTLLDAFHWYKIFRDKGREDKEIEFLNKVNKVETEFPEAAKKGVEFEGVVNDILDRKIVVTQESFGELCYKAEGYLFPCSLVDKIVRRLVNHKKKQEWIQAIIPSSIGNIKIGGFVDYSYDHMYVDLKCTGKYKLDKFKQNNQHKCYPLISKINHGIKAVSDFSYLVTDYTEIFTEPYKFTSQMEEEVLEECYQLYQWLNDRKDIITNQKIFGL